MTPDGSASRGSALPDATADYVQAAGQLAAAFEAFTTGAPGPSLTPLSVLGLASGIVEEIEHLGVERVEALAVLADRYCGRFPRVLA